MTRLQRSIIIQYAIETNQHGLDEMKVDATVTHATVEDVKDPIDGFDSYQDFSEDEAKADPKTT